MILLCNGRRGPKSCAAECYRGGGLQNNKIGVIYWMNEGN